MKRTKVVRLAEVATVLLFTAIVSLASAGQAGAAGPGPASGINVNVVNTPSDPVPVTLKGTGTVSGNVTITNTVPMRDVDNPALQPFQRQETLGFGTGSAGADGTFTVPDGKRLVIEFVTFSLTLPTGQRPLFNIVKVNTANSNQLPVDFFIPLTFQGTAFLGGQNSDVFAGSSATRLYADPATTVTVSVRRGDPVTGNGLASVSISGYLVDLP